MNEVLRNTISIKHCDHGMPEIGEILYEYYEKAMILNIYIDYDRTKKDNIPHKVLTGEQAKKVYIDFSDPVNILSEEIIIDIACDSANLTRDKLFEETRKEEPVYARFLVMWALKKYLHFSFDAAGKVVDKDHATAIHAFKEISKHDRYLKPAQVDIRKRFMSKLRLTLGKIKNTE